MQNLLYDFNLIYICIFIEGIQNMLEDGIIVCHTRNINYMIWHNTLIHEII